MREARREGHSAAEARPRASRGPADTGSSHWDGRPLHFFALENLPEDALLPPLILQPLLENAVYHGIEPLAEGGLIDIRLYCSGNELHLEMYNPREEQGVHHEGNKMALSNIRERLNLQFDIEARYTVESGKDFYRLHILLPLCKRGKP